MPKQPGFTLPEVMITAVVLAIAMVGIAGVATMALKKTSSPNQVQQGAILAAERLAYFRGQADPYRAVGGTWYKPPLRGQQDLNTVIPFHNADGSFNCNNQPHLFVREFVYDMTEKQLDSFGNDQGRNKQGRSQVAGKAYRYNEIPDTDPEWARVLPNDDTVAALPALNPAALNPLPADGPWKAPGIGRAPRANDHIRPGSTLDVSVKYVREVWVQTNVPTMGAGAAGAYPWETIVPRPNMMDGLPPWTVGVVVRVYARDPLQRVFNPLAPNGANLCYNPNRPIAETIGYFGLVRKLLGE